MTNQTDANNSISAEEVLEDWQKHEPLKIIYKIQLYYIPVLCVFGSIGNALSVFVFFSTKLRKLSSSYYLSALAISDTGVLIPIFVTWLELIDVNVFNISIICQTTVYLTHISSFLSVWLVVSFTVERFIAVRYPLRRPSVCTVARARCVLAIMTSISVLLHSPYLFMADLVQAAEIDPATNQSKMVCDLSEDWKPFASKMNHLDFVLTLILPFSMIVVLNTLICKTVCKLARVRRSMTHKQTGSTRNHRHRGNSSANSSTAAAASSSSSQTKVTEMLLIVSTVFICLNLPSYLVRVYVYLVDIRDKEEDYKITLITLQHLALILYNTNFGINFALYCATGQNFRRALMTMFLPRFRRRRTENSTVTGLSEYTRSILHHGVGGGGNMTNSVNRRKTTTINEKNGGINENANLTQTKPNSTGENTDDLWNETNNC